MKVRTDFITNSSSSSFIVSVSPKFDERLKKISRYQSPTFETDIYAIVNNDITKANKFTKADIINAAAAAVHVYDENGIDNFENVDNETIRDILLEFWWKAEFRIRCTVQRDWLKSWSEERLNSEELENKISELYKEYLRVFEDYDDDNVFCEVEYSDNEGAEIYSALEHSIMPDLALVTFNNH